MSPTYSQCASELARQACVRPKGGLLLNHNVLLRLLKPLYSLTDRGDYWHATMTKHLRDDFKMTSLTGYLTCFIRSLYGRLRGLIEIYVDNAIGMDTKEFVEPSKLTEKRFELKPR